MLAPGLLGKQAELQPGMDANGPSRPGTEAPGGPPEWHQRVPCCFLQRTSAGPASPARW